MTIEQMFQAYEDGDITRSELFAHIIATLTPEKVELTRGLLARDGNSLPAFDEWLDDISRGAEVFLGSQAVSPSEACHEAIAVFRQKTNAERYARLAKRMATQWRSMPLRDEATVEPEEVAPFVSRNVDGLIQEAA